MKSRSILLYTILSKLAQLHFNFFGLILRFGFKHNSSSCVHVELHPFIVYYMENIIGSYYGIGLHS